MKSIRTKDTNVVILYGDGAVNHFSDIVNSWSRMIAPGQWDSFQFILAGTSVPELKLEEAAAKVVDDRNTVFYTITENNSTEKADPAPDPNAYHSLIFDKVRTGNVLLHVVYDLGGKDCGTEWLQDLLRSAFSIGALTTSCMYYLFFGRGNYVWEEAHLIAMLKAYPGPTFMLGDTNASGGRVAPEDRLQAAALDILMNAGGLVPIKPGAYSLGYSALNANGAELRHLRESAACRAITEELSRTIDSVNSDLELDLMPGEAGSVSGIYNWLKRYVQENTPQPDAASLKNAWVTIRMDGELPPDDAVRRMKRFADLNFADDQNARTEARKFAWQTERKLKQQLRESVVTAALSDVVFTEIADEMRRIAADDVQPGGVAYPKKPFSLFGGAAAKQAWLQECKSAVMKSIRDYILRKNVCCFAEELEKVYRNVALWVRTVHGEDDMEYRRRITARDMLQDLQRELDSAEAGNASKLAVKYRHYADELNAIRPRLRDLTEGVKGQYYDERGSLNDGDWRELVRKAARNLEKMLSPAFRGDFFKVLTAEFSTQEERERFFDEYLKSGPRMFHHLQAIPSNGMESLLADGRLTDSWFMKKDLYEVKTDNAENLTVYPLGNESPEWYLESDDTVYFLNDKPAGESGPAGGPRRPLFGAAAKADRPETSAMPRNDLFGRRESGTDSRKDGPDETRCPIRLEPDEKNNYRLYWEWYRNDENAMVEIFQYGERVGKVAVIPVKRFKDNGDNMNVTDEIMGGKPLPAGILTVTIRNARKDVIIDSVDVMGRRDVIRYKVNSTRLQLMPEKSNLVDKVVLRTTETDGTQHFYPLYAGRDEHPWLFEGMTISDGRIVEDPTGPGGLVYPVKVD